MSECAQGNRIVHDICDYGYSLHLHRVETVLSPRGAFQGGGG